MRQFLLALAGSLATTACVYNGAGYGPGGEPDDASGGGGGDAARVETDGAPPGTPDAPPLDATDARPPMPDAACGPDRDTDPVCMAGPPVNLDGDAAGVYAVSGSAEAWFELHFAESVMPQHDLSARLELISPPGVDFDLYVRCYACGSTIVASSTYPEGVPDRVDIGAVDFGGDSAFDAVVEIRYAGGTPDGDSCGDWMLTITSDAAPGTQTCF